MTIARLEGFNNTQATRTDGLSLSIADWREAGGAGKQGYRPVETSSDAIRSRETLAVGEATRVRDGVVAAPKTPADASGTITRNTADISYGSAGGYLIIPKEIDGVDQPTEDNSGVQAMPKTQEIPKEPGLTNPEPVPSFPADPITEACENSDPGTGPWSNPEVPLCPGPGIRNNPASGPSLFETQGQ